MEHPERVAALIAALVVLALMVGGAWRLARLASRLRGLPGARLARILYVVGLCLVIGQAAIVIAFSLVLRDPNSITERVLIVGAAQFVTAGGLLWAVRAVERL